MSKGRLLTLVTLGLLLVATIRIYSVKSSDVVVVGSILEDTYYQGDVMTIRVAIMNNASSENTLEIILINTTIWRIEQRYERWRNIEVIYNRTDNIGTTIERNEVFSTEIEIKINFQPARYNITVEVRAKFRAGAAGEQSYYVVKGHMFWVKSSLSIPPMAWALVLDVIIIIAALFVYRKLK
ncbi:MAG: hypothetical protein Q6363_006180 [Candidatus Njordarchaeota archaeon]